MKRGVGEIVESLTAGFTAVMLPFDLSSTCSNNVFSKMVQPSDCCIADKQAHLYAFAPRFHQSHDMELPSFSFEIAKSI